MKEGSKLLVRYDEDLWHERVLLARVVGSRWVIVTPDGDVYSEDMGPHNDDITAVRACGVNGARPAGFKDRVYGWATGRTPTGRPLAALIEEGRQLALLEGGADATSPWAPVTAAGAPQKNWVIKFGREGSTLGVGDVVAEPTTRLGNMGLAEVNGAIVVVEEILASDVQSYRAVLSKPLLSETDARVLAVRYDESGDRARPWMEVARGIAQSTMSDFPVSGPRTTAWVVRFLARRGTGPEDHHRWWRSTARLSGTDWGVGEHQMCCRILQQSGCFDQLDLANLAGMEIIARRLQLIEYQYRDRVRDTERTVSSGASGLLGQNLMTADEADLFDGASHVAPTVCCCPLLVAHVSEELGKEARIHSEARKAREEKALLRGPHAHPPAEEGKGGGKKK